MRVHMKHSGQHKRHLVNASCQHHHPAPKGKASPPPYRTDPFHQGRQAQVSLIVPRARVSACGYCITAGKQPGDHEEVGRRDWQPTHTVLPVPA